MPIPPRIALDLKLCLEVLWAGPTDLIIHKFRDLQGIWEPKTDPVVQSPLELPLPPTLEKVVVSLVEHQTKELGCS